MVSKPIEIERSETWPAGLAEEIDRLAAPLEKLSKRDRYYGVHDGAAPEVNRWLGGRRIVAFHGTRLLPHEVSSVKAEGLKPSSLKALEEKLEAAQQAYPHLLDSKKIAAILKETPLRNPTHRGRLGQVCVVGNFESFEFESQGLHPFLSHWGGEMVYFHANATRKDIDELTKLSAPAIAEIAIPFDDIPGFGSERIGRGMLAHKLGVEFVSEAHVRPPANIPLRRLITESEPGWPVVDLDPYARMW